MPPEGAAGSQAPGEGGRAVGDADIPAHALTLPGLDTVPGHVASLPGPASPGAVGSLTRRAPEQGGSRGSRGQRSAEGAYLVVPVALAVTLWERGESAPRAHAAPAPGRRRHWRPQGAHQSSGGVPHSPTRGSGLGRGTPSGAPVKPRVSAGWARHRPDRGAPDRQPAHSEQTWGDVGCGGAETLGKGRVGGAARLPLTQRPVETNPRLQLVKGRSGPPGKPTRSTALETTAMPLGDPEERLGPATSRTRACPVSPQHTPLWACRRRCPGLRMRGSSPQPRGAEGGLGEGLEGRAEGRCPRAGAGSDRGAGGSQGADRRSGWSWAGTGEAVGSWPVGCQDPLPTQTLAGRTARASPPPPHQPLPA